MAVLILRRDPVDHDHFRTPTFIPVLGAIVSLGMFTQHEAGIYLRAGILLVVGVVLWFVNRAAGRGTAASSTPRTGRLTCDSTAFRSLTRVVGSRQV